MPSKYPAELDALSTANEDATTSKTTHPALHNDVNDAVNKIETELGAEPSGSYKDVATRLGALNPGKNLGIYNITDAEYGAETKAENNKTAIQKAINAAAEAYTSTGSLQIVWIPGGVYKTGTLKMKTGVILDGSGTLKLISGETDLLSTEKLGEGGQDFYQVHNIKLDGNATGGGKGSCWNSDGRRVRGFNVEVYNAAECGLRHRQSGAQLSAAEGGDDSFFLWIFAYNNTTVDILDEAHDCGFSHCRMIGKAKVGFENTGSGTEAMLYDCHVWSKSERHEYDFNFEGSFQATSCTAEGASKVQVRVKDHGVWIGGRVFSVEGAENVPLFELRESGTRLIMNGALLAAVKGSVKGAFVPGAKAAGSGSKLEFTLEGEESEAFAKGEGENSWNENIYVNASYRGKTKAGTPPQAPSVPSASINGEELLKRSHLTTIKVSGEAKIENLPVTYAGHQLTLIFTSTAELVKAGNLKIKESIKPGANGAYTLVCDGTNWYGPA